MKMNQLLMAGALLLTASSLAHVSSVAHAADSSVTTNGDVNFIEDTDPTDPLDPVDPTNPVVPVDPITPTDGPLSIDYASKFHFGQQKISSKDEIYFAAFDKVYDADGTTELDKPNWVQVSDKRGTNAGWKLQVQQGAQFTTGTGLDAKELVGAELQITNAKAKSTPDNQATAPTAPTTITLDPSADAGVTPGAAQDVMTADLDQGMGTWLDVFGDNTSGNQSIKLTVPGVSAKEKDATYTTELTWLLTDTAV